MWTIDLRDKEVEWQTFTFNQPTKEKTKELLKKKKESMLKVLETKKNIMNVFSENWKDICQIYKDLSEEERMLIEVDNHINDSETFLNMYPNLKKHKRKKQLSFVPECLENYSIEKEINKMKKYFVWNYTPEKYIAIHNVAMWTTTLPQ